MEDCRVEEGASCIYFKSNRDRGGFIENARIRRIQVDISKAAVIRFETNYQGYRGGILPASPRSSSMADRVPVVPQAGGGTLIPTSIGSSCLISAGADEARRMQAAQKSISPPTRQPIWVESGESSAQAVQRFEHYELVTGEDGKPVELGRGAMGVTYKAFDVDLHCPHPTRLLKLRFQLPELLRVHRSSLVRSNSPELAWTSARTSTRWAWCSGRW
jgi:hypothetical protein